MNRISVDLATPAEYETVGKLVHKLLNELFPVEQEQRREDYYVSAANKLLSSDSDVWALVAKTKSGEIVGVLTLNQCTAIYAGGCFGEICELYVDSTQRSSGIGEHLINAAKRFAKKKQWPELEVGAPPLPKWQKSVDFYMSQGFKYSGPRLYFEL